MASDSTASTTLASSAGPWAPLGQPTFRAFWLAILASNIGTWIHDVAAAWVMAENTGSPFMVAAVQSATTLPVVLLALVAGTLADIVDRRRYLIITQLWMFGVALALALLAFAGLLGPWGLVALTFALGAGAAMTMPAQQATTPELVQRPLLAPAVALGSLSMNIARSIGPAMGGLIVAQAGAAWAFGLNAISFLAIVFVLMRWRREPSTSVLPPESFGSALRAGLRYASQASAFQAVLVKAAVFFVFTSAFTALLPIVVKQDLQAGAGSYGLLLGCIGIGAIVGAVILPKLRKRFDPDRVVLAATWAYAACMTALALVRDINILYVVLLVAGFAWISVLSSLQVAAQTSVPQWVRARGLALYILVFSAGMATGSLLWGALAQQQSSAVALLTAAAGAVVASLLSRRFQLRMASTVDVMPSGHWPQPVHVEDIAGDRGPVLVTVEYRIAPERREEFLRKIAQLGSSRKRDGAFEWGVAEDTEQPGVYLEYFLTASWLEHLRQHERVTHDDRRVQQELLALHEAPQPPRVRHLVGGTPGVGLKRLRDEGGMEL